MKAIDCPFTKIINGTTQFVIPVFQRDYSWSEAQCEQLWRDILRIAREPRDRGHFLGSVVYVSTGDSSAGFTRWLLIDGQQRVTTITLLLIALRDHLVDAGWSGAEDGPTAQRIEAYFLKNLQEEGGRQHKLVLRRHDQAALEAILDREPLPSDAPPRLRENFEFFKEQIADADPAEVYRGIGRLIVVDVTLQRGVDDPQLIFESLNSTGLDLSQSDLIRNYVLMRLPEKEQTRLYESYWSKIEALFRGSEKTFDAFVRDYMAIKTRASKQERADEIYHAFRVVVESFQAELGSLDAVLAEMLRFGRFHAAFSIGRHAPGPLADALARLRRLVDVPATLVMRLFDCFERHQTLTEPEFIEALGLIEGYVFRRAICGEQTRGYWQVFSGLAYGIDDSKPLQSLKVGLARQRDAYRYPTDAEFRQALEERDLYGLRVCGALLDRLENDGSREPTDTSTLTIEHVMPQNEKLLPQWREMLGSEWKEVHRTWLHRLGNLTLTGYNSTYSDRSFEDKKLIPGGFADSAVRLNRFIREQAVWTPVEMSQRGKELAGRTLAIWPELVVDPELIEAAEQQEMRDLAKRRDVGKVKMSIRAKELFEHLRANVLALTTTVVELAEQQSISYHAPGFFLEVLPRKHGLNLLLPLDFNEVDDPTGIARDATEWKFLVHAQHEGGVSLSISGVEDIDRALPMIRQAFVASQ
jgi:predicted transport protein